MAPKILILGPHHSFRLQLPPALCPDIPLACLSQARSSGPRRRSTRSSALLPRLLYVPCHCSASHGHALTGLCSSLPSPPCFLGLRVEDPRGVQAGHRREVRRRHLHLLPGGLGSLHWQGEPASTLPTSHGPTDLADVIRSISSTRSSSRGSLSRSRPSPTVSPAACLALAQLSLILRSLSL